jgi:hypothetical protein
MASRSVKIGPSFFAGAFRDYANWQWAWVREIMQNSIDAGSCTVTVTIDYDANADHTVISVANDGAPMTEDVLCNKLLAIGESGKRFQSGNVGGFGKAKEILLMAHPRWTVRTGTLCASGSGGDYDLVENLELLHGTTTTVAMAGDHVGDLQLQWAKFATLAQWDGDLIVCGVNQNGVDQRLHLKKGSRRKDFTWGTVYTNNSAQGLLLCRIGGIPMFTKPIRYKSMVLVELAGTSADVLTSNRDGLRWTQQSELDQFIAEIAVNTKSAFKDKARKVEKVRFAGYKLQGCSDDHEVELGEAVRTETPVFVQTALVEAVANATTKTQAADAPALSTEQVRSVFRPEFFLKSEIGGKIPEWFLPGSFSDNSKRLISNWIGLLVELAAITGLKKTFSVGFIFDPDCEGQYERENGENVVYVSPVEIVQKEGMPRQLKVRWKFNAAGNWALLALALHEFCHLEGYSSHDEDYAGRLTDLFALALQNRTRLSRHFSAPVAWPD